MNSISMKCTRLIQFEVLFYSNLNMICFSLSLIKSGHMPKNQIKGFGTNLIRLIYVLDNPEIGIDMVKNHQVFSTVHRVGESSVTVTKNYSFLGS